MKNDKYRTYIYWGVTALTVLLLLVAAVFVVMRWSLVAALGAKIANILAPVIYGAVFAYLLNPVYNRVQAAVMKMTEKIITQEEGRKRLGGFLGTLASLFLLVAVVVGLISMLIPQLINSISGVMETLPASINNLEIWLEKVLADNPDLEQQVMQALRRSSRLSAELADKCSGTEHLPDHWKRLQRSGTGGTGRV